MNYKKSINLIGAIFIGLYIIIFYIIQRYEKIELESGIITELTYQYHISSIVLFLVFLVLLTIFISYKIEKRITSYSIENKRSREHLEAVNKFYSAIQDTNEMKEIGGLSLEFIVELFDAKSGLIYLANYKNMKLLLIDGYNIDIEKTQKIIDIYSGVAGEAFATKKIKKHIKKDVIYFAIPLISNNKTVGIVELKFSQNISSLKIDKIDKTILQIIAATLIKQLEHEKNKRYYNLIDKYVLLSSTNTDGDITYVSESFCKASGYEKKELLGQNHRILKDPLVKNILYKKMWETVSAGKSWEAELSSIKKDGSRYWANTKIIPRFDLYNNIIGYDAIRVDITDKKLVEQLSITDALTSLYNRRYFDKVFLQRINLAKRVEAILCFCMIDIDHFKQYNDTYGHQDGDETLKKVASSLQQTLNRDDDFVFRLGGEEFGLLYFTSKPQDAIDLANKTRTNIENLKIIHEKNSASAFVTVSMGVYIYDDEELTPDEIYKKTDKLLYKAKQNGRNTLITNEENKLK